ncbi:MAG: type II toxin-antitoxin system RelE/ParE family toxin [Bacteroidales bacterium]|nr:type II toxin-antitoxin system RelE/ParE family toxin [Bacteroidales bacterium]
MASNELEDAVEYYDDKVKGLGKKFKEEIKSGIKRIREHPQMWQEEKYGIRRYLLYRFPFKILFSIEKDYILIVAIAHCHRRPNYWINRIV